MMQLEQARHLDEHGRCCGRKPIRYKRPYLRFFCFRCDRQYDPNGKQIPNWAYQEVPGAGFTRRSK